MRQCLAVVVPLLGGCSFIYNPDHINKDIDAQVADVEIVTDVDPSMLDLVDLFPNKVNEGAGTGNARAATFVISGHQIASDAVVSISPDSQDAATVHLTSQMVATDANFIAFTLAVDDNATLDDQTERPVIVTVTQSGGTITRSFDATKLVVHHLDSLTTQITSAPPRALYSMIDVKTTLPFAANSTSGPISLRAVGPIHVTGKVGADGTPTVPGPGGCTGGAAGSSGAVTNGLGWSCIGHGLSSGAGLLANVGGGGAGFVSGGAQGGGSGGGQGGGVAGNIYIDQFSNNVPSGGGGGGLAQLLGAAQAGGCGGGILELTAGGDLTLDAGVSAIGGDGVGGNGGDGGGGAGGVVLLRSAATVAVTGNVTVTQGHGGTGGTAGGDASVGRIRVDAAKGTLPMAAYNGPMFVDPPAMTHEKMPNLMLRGVMGDTTATLTVFDSTGHPTSGPSPIAFGPDPMLAYAVTLTSGYNKVCVVVKNGNLSTNPESGNCTEIAFLPGP